MGLVLLTKVGNRYPKSLSEKVNMFLLMIYKKSEYMGQYVCIPINEQSGALFLRNKSDLIKSEAADCQSEFFVKFLKGQDFLSSNCEYDLFCLSDEGYKRDDELQKNKSKNRDVFISMDFDDKYEDIANSIKKGIVNAGFNPVFMKDIIHNKQIVPLMFQLIRESRFLVMDTTYPNLGAYHESGYALGLGKEVIISCREEEFRDANNKPHFDIAQKQILVWKDCEDLVKKLSEWIKVLAK